MPSYMDRESGEEAPSRQQNTRLSQAAPGSKLAAVCRLDWLMPALVGSGAMEQGVQGVDAAARLLPMRCPCCEAPGTMEAGRRFPQ